MSLPHLILIELGNSCTRVAPAKDGELGAVTRLEGADLDATMAAIHQTQREIGTPCPILLASVEQSREALLAPQLASLGEVYRLGEDLPVPIQQDLEPEAMTGIDRLLAATAAWDAMQQACIVVDAGTAITVDFVDGAGVFHGGAIAPGASLQLQSLHQHTDALPALTPASPPAEPFGRSTSDAIHLGVAAAMQGIVHVLIERYASHYEALPPVIITGGDATTYFADDPFVDRIVPDLTLRGMLVSARAALGTPTGDDA